MKFILFLSDLLIPLLILFLISTALLQKLPVFDLFTEGTSRGFRTVLKTAPALIGLMMAVSALRASGFLDFLETLFLPVEKIIHFPAELIPLSLVRLFSTSAATGFLFDIFKESGPDSFQGLLASLFMSSTEAAFYTMSIYYSIVHIKKTRWTLPGALLATAAGMTASFLLASSLI